MPLPVALPPRRGRAALDHVDAIGYSGFLLERAVAGLTRLSKTMFLRVDRCDADVEIQAAYAWGPARNKPGVRSVTRGQVQALHVLLDHAEQSVGPLRTDGRGAFQVVPLGRERWNYETQDYELARTDPEVDPVEVHVHDDETGAHAVELVEAKAC